MNKGRFEGGHDHTLERKVDNKQKVLQLLGHRRRSTTPVIGAGRRVEAQFLGRELEGRCSLRIRPGHQLIDARCRPRIGKPLTSLRDPPSDIGQRRASQHNITFSPPTFWRPLDPAHLEKKVVRALAGRTAAPADPPGNGR